MATTSQPKAKPMLPQSIRSSSISFSRYGFIKTYFCGQNQAQYWLLVKFCQGNIISKRIIKLSIERNIYILDVLMRSMFQDSQYLKSLSECQI